MVAEQQGEGRCVEEAFYHMVADSARRQFKVTELNDPVPWSFRLTTQVLLRHTT